MVVQLTRVISTRFLRVALSLLVLAGLSACSMTELVYGKADWLARRWVGDLVDASDAQQAAWREPFEQAMLQHRATLLPQVVAWLDRAEDEIGRGLERKGLQRLIDDVEILYREHARLAVPLAVRVLQDLSPAQIDYFASELAERNEEYRERYLHEAPAQRRQARFERYAERIERWTGDLSTIQLAVIKRQVEAMPDTAEPWLAYRYQQQRRLLALLRGGADTTELERFLSAWWIDLADRPAVLVSSGRQLRLDSIGLFIELDRQFSAQQRSELIAEIGRVRADLHEIVAMR